MAPCEKSIPVTTTSQPPRAGLNAENCLVINARIAACSWPSAVVVASLLRSTRAAVRVTAASSRRTPDAVFVQFHAHCLRSASSPRTMPSNMCGATCAPIASCARSLSAVSVCSSSARTVACIALSASSPRSMALSVAITATSGLSRMLLRSALVADTMRSVWSTSMRPAHTAIFTVAERPPAVMVPVTATPGESAAGRSRKVP